MHQRLKPRQRSFTYNVFMLDVDLDLLSETARKIHGLSHNGFNLFAINDSDHIDLKVDGGIRGNLTEWIKRQEVNLPADARIRLVTFPRVLGYGFNPVSFYYISDAGGTPLFAVAEVVNTFREMKLYLIDQRNDHGSWSRKTAKNFYVSPFSDPGDFFDFRLGVPGNEWQVNIDDFNAEEKILLSSIRGNARLLTTRALLLCAVKYPLLSLKIIGLIHWHALLLWMRRVPFFRKSDRLESQVDLLRPHASLNKDLP